MLLLFNLLLQATGPVDPPSELPSRPQITSCGGPGATLSASQYLKEFGLAGLPPRAKAQVKRRRATEILIIH